MKIEITKDVVGEILSLTYLAMKDIVLKTVAKEEEKELFIALRASKKLSPKQRVLGYLHNTKVGVTTMTTDRTVIVESEFLRHQLGMSVYAMRAIRDELLKEGSITVIGSAPKRIKFTNAVETPAATETTKTN